MSPRLMLYRMELDDEFGEPYYVEATIPEVIAWLREQGAVKEVVVRQNAVGDSYIHMAGNPLADAAVNLKTGSYLVAAFPPTGETPNG